MAGCVPPGFIGTIEDDDEVEIEDGDESEEDEVILHAGMYFNISFFIPFIR